MRALSVDFCTFSKWPACMECIMVTSKHMWSLGSQWKRLAWLLGRILSCAAWRWSGCTAAAASGTASCSLPARHPGSGSPGAPGRRHTETLSGWGSLDSSQLSVHRESAMGGLPATYAPSAAASLCWAGPVAVCTQIPPPRWFSTTTPRRSQADTKSSWSLGLFCLWGRGINSWFPSLRKMDSDIPEAFQKELTCLVCLNYLLDPVTMGCGHSFCRSCLCLFWEQAEDPASCPVCRQRSEQTNLKTNYLLKNLVSIARKANLGQFLNSEEHMCGTHKETKKIFCEAHKSLLCLVCSQSQEHRAHRHRSTEEAAEEYWVSDVCESAWRAGGRCS